MTMPGLGEMGETDLTPSQIQLGWSAPSSQTHTPAPAAVPPHVYSPMSFEHMSDYQSRNQHIFYSTQIQGAATSIQAVQDQLIHLSPSRSTGPPPPPPPAGTSTATNIPPAPATSSSDLKFAKPNKFGGKKEDALNFIITCQAYIRAKGANQSHEEKFLWVTSYFEGAAEDWKILMYFGPNSPNIMWTPIVMKNIAKNGTICDRRLHNETLRDKYYDGLKNDIKDIMLSTMFQWRHATAQQVYDKAEEIANHIKSTRLSNPSVSTICAPSSATPTSTSNPTPICTCLNVGDNVYMIDPTTHRAKKGAITSIVQTTSGNMPNVRWNGETKDTMIPFPSLKKDERPAAAAPVKPIIAPVPVLASNSKGPGPMDLDGRGFANLTCHLLPDAKPQHGPIYSLGPREDAELKETIEKQLKARLIQPSKSPMASPILFVKKKNGKLRMCVDYRRLNSMTKKNVYPLPLPQNLIEKLQGAKIFSKFDLKAGYNLVQIKEGDKWKTAFKTKYGLFEYLVMPFGLTNAPAVFQDMMNEIFRDLLDVYVIIYLDNILVFSSNERDHKAHVREVLKRLQDNDLFCNIKKCHFHVKKIDYLGFIISESGIEVDQSKVTDAMDWSTPKNVKNVQEFLGFVNFYRRFIPNFGNMAQPLYNLLKKDSVWKWDLAEQQSFEGLKKCLTSAPLLLQPDTTRQFYVECNASDYATGAILSQRNSEGKLAPVAYLSKSLSPAKKNYDIFDKELLAVIRAFKEWRHLLEGSELPVQVLTDHKNLEYFSTSQSLNKRQIRWANFLVDYNFQIIYRPGAQNKKADILSRRYNLVPLEGGVENQVLLKPELFIASITPDQEINDLIGEAIYKDDCLKEILHKLQNKEKVLDWELREGLLWFQGKIFVPKDDTIRNLILESRHDALAAGHPGQARTLELVSRSYYWPSLKKFVNSYVSHCKTCIRSKPTNQLPVGLLKPLQIPERPWEDIAYDMIVGLPVSEGFDAILTVID
ncbi:Retrotransposable element Tf2 protein [Rhizoctonia solani]|uniref:Retrotransposable element Tf2 protein n=1 Tax=Rhizoctonia solani TaxID=456999 RepID=A0A8H8NYX7_9AGAM|nr:Retrotransposable element Tf2 protein [Rhizoctonia solani]QRW21225.1 Retrotransposable element Tf2 protein [Rhizoctonia solani]